MAVAPPQEGWLKMSDELDQLDQRRKQRFTTSDRLMLVAFVMAIEAMDLLARAYHLAQHLEYVR